ncbi:MAG: tetratricopeptide repeat protein, partial [Chloroflexota bacterium]
SALHVSQNEAVRLFIERAQAARPDFSVTNETAPTVAELCHRLDGLPLAIELAAARVRALPVQALLERMDRRLPLLKGGPRDAPARQQTLHGTIAWSYDLLNPEEQMLFRRLAVFRGCTLEAIDDVCVARAVHPSSSSVAPSSVALEPLTMEVLDSVTSLVEKSLLRQEETADGQPWYVMLETIREFALEQLEACSEADIVRRRHVLYCLRLAETAEPQLFGPQQGTWLARLEREHDNLRGALRWCEAQGYAEPVFRLAAALTWFWAVRGHMSEGRERFATLLARFRRHGAGGSRAAMRARALHAAATLHSFQGDYDAARSLQEEGLRVLEEQGDMAGVYAALEALGLIASQQHDYQAARAYLEKGIDVARAQQDKHAIGNALHNLANVLHEQGEYAAARALLEESLPFYMEATEAGDTRGAANVYKFLGIVALDQGDHDTARLMTEKSLALMDQVGDLRQIAIVMVGRGSVATAQGDYVTARECLSQSLATLREIGDVAAIAFVLERFAGLAAAQGHAQRAIRIAGAAAAMREASGVPLTPSAQGKLESALHAARQALGETATAAAWEAGCTLSVEEAVAYALADTDTNSVPDGRATDTTRSTPLSRREQEVAVLIARGYTNRQIARELVITEGTAANHVIHILNKLGFSSRAQVAAWMVEQGLAGAR